jgi:succinyl-CoA:(S)-malate CoA-transferase subunit A
MEWVGSLSREDVMQRCLDKQVPVGKVNSIADIFEDEHFQARGNLARVDADDLGEVIVPGVLPTLSETPGRITNLGPSLGNATDEVLRDLLGISVEEIETMRNHRII